MTFARTIEIDPIPVLSDQIRLLLRSSMSPSQMSAMVVDVPPGGFVPPHSHADEEEGYYVLDGALQLMVDGEERVLEKGDFAHVPPQTLHGYSNNCDGPVRFLAWTVGGPIDRFFETMSREVKEMPRDAAQMAAITRQFGITMAGPPA